MRKEERLARALGRIDPKYILEAEPLNRVETEDKKKNAPPLWRGIPGRAAAAAVLALCLLAGGIVLFAPKSAAVTVWSSQGEEITSAGASFTTGRVSDGGELTGHPLMFHLAGKGIESVRFSCKNGRINFTDLTERRDEFGAVQNFTVPYGADESEYDFLVIDWIPQEALTALRSGAYPSVAALPAGLREDTVVLEIAFTGGRSVSKALQIALNDDGSFRAAMEDYPMEDAEEFVKRPDSQPIPREALYGQGDVTVTFRGAAGDEVEPEACWYNMKDAETVTVCWTGRCAEGVQMFFTPAGTETYEEMELISTRVVESAENRVVFSTEGLRREDLMGHLDFLIDLGGGSTVRSELYNVFYDPNF